MATLGKSVDALALFGPALSERGFIREPNQLGCSLYLRLRNASEQRVAFDRVKTGGLLRILVAIDRMPNLYAARAVGIEGESPYWRCHDQSELQIALKDAWTFLETSGFVWLEDPMALTPTVCRERHNLLVRDFRQADVQVRWQQSMPLNERVMKAKACLPPFRNLSALQIRERLEKLTEIHLGTIPYANALELKAEAERLGFIVNVRFIQ